MKLVGQEWRELRWAGVEDSTLTGFWLSILHTAYATLFGWQGTPFARLDRRRDEGPRELFPIVCPVWVEALVRACERPPFVEARLEGMSAPEHVERALTPRLGLFARATLGAMPGQLESVYAIAGQRGIDAVAAPYREEVMLDPMRAMHPVGPTAFEIREAFALQPPPEHVLGITKEWLWPLGGGNFWSQVWANLDTKALYDKGRWFR